MRYMLLIHTNPANWATLSEAEGNAMYAEYTAFTQRLVDAGEFVSGDPLQGPETATTVRVRDGQRSTTDGPFVETKEALGGYLFLDADDLDAAIELAAGIPAASMGGAIEIRPVVES